ncbi:hypothetical protein FRB99_007466 [Tulasnella sp. 403]|nr:hypothetical protein FRB99_007466 [Tulasnella sp. 403]
MSSTTQSTLPPTLPPARSSTPLLPTELWIFIFELLRHLELPLLPCQEFTSTDTSLRNVTATSRLFYALATPLRYQAFCLAIHNGCYTKATQQRLSVLNARPRIYNWVKYLHLSVTFPPQYRAFSEFVLRHQVHSLSQDVSSHFTRMHALTHVAFSGFRITHPMYSHLYRLPSLTHIRLHNPLRPLEPFTFYQPQTLPITSLVLAEFDLQPSTNLPLSIALLARSPKLQHLTFQGLTIHASITNALSASPSFVFANLTALALAEPFHDTELADFFAFLRLCPFVTHLSITNRRHISHYSPLLLQIPTDILPLLLNYDGPLRLAVALIPGRPVHSICISTRGLYPTQLTPSHFSALALTNASVTSLSLEIWGWLDDYPCYIAHAFPNLLALSIQFYSGTSTPSLEPLSHLPFLRLSSPTLTSNPPSTYADQNVVFHRIKPTLWSVLHTLDLDWKLSS